MISSKSSRRRARLLGAVSGAALAVGLLPVTAASAQVTAADVDDICPAPGQVDAFTDDTLNTFEDRINCAAAYDLVTGKTPTTFDPQGFLTRGQAATILVNYVEISNCGVELVTDATDDFTDVDGNVHEANIQKAADNGIVNGYNDNTFRPDMLITRAQFATMAVQATEVALGEDLDANATRDFDDIAGNVHAENIEKAFDNGMLVGTSPRMFSPNLNVTRGQATSIVIGAAGQILFPAGEFCPAEDGPGTATALDLTPEDAVNPVGTDHTVTATLTDAGGGASVDGELVRFEVYGEPVDDFGPIGGARQARFFETGGIVEVEGGVATFTYTDNESESQNPNDGLGGTNATAEDYIIACVVEVASDNCVLEQVSFFGEDDFLVVDSITGEPINVDQDPSDFATKQFEEREAATVTLTPESDVNVLNDEHVLTATVLDQFGDPVEDEDVRLDLFRDVDVDDNAAAPAAPTDVGFVYGTTFPAEPTLEDGTVEFTVSSPVEASDLYVVCIDSDDDATAGRCTDVIPVGTPADPLTAADITLADEDDASDTATKEWDEAVAEILSLTPATDVNPAGATHTVTATVVDQLDDPFVGETVTFQVFERVNADFTPVDAGDTVDSTLNNQGTVDDEADDTAEATFDFTNADAGDFTIVACLDADDDGCAAVNINGDLVLDADDPSSATALKSFIGLDATPADGTFSGVVVGTPGANSFNLFTGDDFITVTYVGGAAGDLFRIAGAPVTEAQFEAALSAGDAVTVTLDSGPDPTDVSTLNITTDLDAVAPAFTSSSPTTGATGVAVGGNLTATFNEALATTSTATLTCGGITVEGATTVSGTTITFDPGTDLGALTTCAVTFTARDAAGNVSAATPVSFTTA